ncbi:MAG: hypothetical protein FJ005_02150 [Chloroflexi bacterium]|nr:hypothetical protein [Chloroflexota bacterium]
MMYRETLTLKSDKPIEAKLLKELGNRLQQRGIEVYILDVDTYCLEMCHKLIMEKGPRYILSLERLQEAVLPKMGSIDLHIKVLSNYLQVLSPSKDLTIVDQYFFSVKPSDREEYLGTFREIFGLVIPKVAMVRFITKPDHDRALYKDIKSVLIDLNPEINVVHKMTKDFHDRYWIADEVKSLFIGTSLNGIGKKYALADFMEAEDTATIVKELKRASLI